MELANLDKFTNFVKSVTANVVMITLCCLVIAVCIVMLWSIAVGVYKQFKK